eukprot:CAMPEP_0172448776 /NCGR_PEP_ID=MMETSP1065-20121228/7724_1 /TAXON_ID=265537 /ORGANISM="Amphiprora paludosa, Strain CCMP125" /LENGTH=106 /DNA_ID=CAMNT_0013200361 /DNA_START=54 /DNA_END=371 /DNA_ORIENTATION=-
MKTLLFPMLHLAMAIQQAQSLRELAGTQRPSFLSAKLHSFGLEPWAKPLLSLRGGGDSEVDRDDHESKKKKKKTTKTKSSNNSHKKRKHKKAKDKKESQEKKQIAQ